MIKLTSSEMLGMETADLVLHLQKREAWLEKRVTELHLLATDRLLMLIEAKQSSDDLAEDLADALASTKAKEEEKA